MKRLFLTGVVGLLGVAGPLGAAAMTGAGAAPAAASPNVALYHMPVIGKNVLPNIASHLSGRFNATSTNWSGYAATTNTFQNISGSWVQPTVTCAQSGGGFLGLGGAPTAYSSFWVGLDGYTSTTVEQTGTDSDCDAGKPTYYAWYEMYPAASVDISTTSYPVTPGDTITGSVVPAAGSFTLKLTDTSTKHASWTFTVAPLDRKHQLRPFVGRVGGRSTVDVLDSLLQRHLAGQLRHGGVLQCVRQHSGPADGEQADQRLRQCADHHGQQHGIGQGHAFGPQHGGQRVHREVERLIASARCASLA